ncbi:MAG: T9SS type A sorting domain-containing protein [Ignavibacteriaceae bacterium]
MKTNIIFLLVLCWVIALPAQNKVLLKASGEIITSNETTSSNLKQEKKDKKRNNTESLVRSIPAKSINALLDTLTYFPNHDANTNFGIFGQDWLLQWFIAPTDMIIKSAGISISEVPTTNVQLEVKLVTLKWTKAEIIAVGIKRLGFYQADSNGYNNITAFQDNPDRTGDWVDASGLGLTSPFAEDIWSDSGKGLIIDPIVKTPEQNYQWIDMNTLGKEPVIARGQIIGVAVRNLNPVMDSARVGISSGLQPALPGFKFYSNGGWWLRDYTFDFALEVEMGEGCRWYFHPNITQLTTTLSTEPREVSADIIHCEFQDIEKSKVELVYSFDKGVSYTKTQMTTTDSADYFQTFKGTIPGAQPGTQVLYYILYTDAVGNQSMSITVSYYIFKIENPSLLIFNGYTNPEGYPQSYYFGTGDTVNYKTVQWAHDVWAYGPLTLELVNNYQNIIEICTTGPANYNDDVIREWLNGGANRNYFLAGQEYLGSRYEFRDTVFSAGHFVHDILGIKQSYNDVNFVRGTSDNKKPSRLFPIQNSLLGGELYTLFNAQPTDSLRYDPVYEIGDEDNWIDGFEIVEKAEPDLYVESRAIEGTPLVDTLITAAHRILPNGNKIAFLAFDPLSINSSPKHYWYGFSTSSLQVQALKWFGIDSLTSVEEGRKLLPARFSLSQNYPNPFNPNTTINYQLPATSFVTLKVYDVLGKEVAILVNEEKQAGSYKIDFNRSHLASGIYFYTLRANNFVRNRKMILLK